MAEIFTHKYLIAQNKIRHAIENLKIDDRLPGERVLAKELGISYMTVRKAVENLVEEGALYRIAKKGTYVADPKLKRKNCIGFADDFRRNDYGTASECRWPGIRQWLRTAEPDYSTKHPGCGHI